ncbi:hypothetical protein QBC46DRAFT_342924 [Diplogelasinospora grovesii]|uniref:Uncharacterized protein n=1 Tax=Diplogelasinospora grovesii TaxID=303347 RepID=A0AAN6S3D9_9PEZI|nr:hypothetical protein QBC46DRAFT_342924 [Diplogelasinospora grovesii]
MSSSSSLSLPTEDAPTTKETNADLTELLLSRLLSRPNDIVDITLSGPEARRLVELLEESRAREQQLAQKEEELKQFRFLTRYGDYAKSVWTDMKVPEGGSLEEAIKMHDETDLFARDFVYTSYRLGYQMDWKKALLSTETYAERNRVCHAPIEDHIASQDYDGLANLVDKDKSDPLP